ncbi:MAG: phage portal protein [Rickettsiales bacterium]
MWPFTRKPEAPKAAGKQPQARRPVRPSAKRYYAAAKKDRLTSGWGTGVVSADAALCGDLEKLRARSRLLAANDPYFRYSLKLARRNVVGAYGVRLQMKVVERHDPDGSAVADDLANRLIEEAWRDWGKRQHCTVSKRMDFVAVQKLVLSSALRDGEIFVRKIKGYEGNAYRFALQIIEADHLDVGHNAAVAGNNTIRMGVEFNDWGEAVAYHFRERHPGDYLGSRHGSARRVRIPAEQILHVYDPERADQTRGAPDSSASMTRSNMLNGYEEAELVAARAASGKMGFFTTPDGESYEGEDAEYDEAGNETAVIAEADPGTFDELPEGYGFTPYDPQHPTTAFQPFVKTILRGMASGMGVNYNLLANDYEGVNFSSLRQANLNDRDGWKETQQWFVEQLHEQIFGDWLLMALTSGQIALPAEKFDKFNKPAWRPRGWNWVDPLKEAGANRINVDMGTDTLTSIAAEQGREIEEIFQERKSEITLAKKYGIHLASGGGDAPPSDPPPPGEVDDNADNEDDADAEEN